MTPIIQIKDLTKCYGKRTAVNALSLSVNKGDIFGFVGPNGAGKTSTIRIMAGLLQPTSGEIIIGGRSVSQDKRAVKRMIGYMPDYFGVYPELKAWEYLDFFAACYLIPQAERPALINSLLELVDLTHRKEDTIEGLSRGMKQRLSLARTLLHDPDVLILDEPAAGLDPRARVEIRELLVELAKMDKTIFFSTHILSDAAEICTQVGIIEAGELVASGALEELHLQTMPYRRIEITLLDNLEAAEDLLCELPGVEALEGSPAGKNGNYDRLIFEFSGDDRALSQLLTTLVNQRIPVLHFSEDNRDLEEVFLRKTKGLVT